MSHANEYAIVGCGDIGLRVAQRLHSANQANTITGWSRRQCEGFSRFQVLDLDQAAPVSPLQKQVIYTAPPPKAGMSDPRMRRFLSAADAVEVMVYISTSGVYGDCDGQWVDESFPAQPQSERAQRRWDAEKALHEWAQAKAGRRLVILRVPGIYGPDRLPRARLEAAKPIIEPSQAPWSNRIHADDLAAACVLAAEKGEGLYNVADGSPSSMSDYFIACAEHLGLPCPPLISRAEADQQYTAAMLSFVRENRRMSIEKIQRELGFQPQYPNLEAGLLAC